MRARFGGRGGVQYASGGGVGGELQAAGAHSLASDLESANSTSVEERRDGAQAAIDHNSIAADDAAAGGAIHNQAAATATADSATKAATKKQPEPEQQAAAPAAALEPMELQMEVQMGQVGQEGRMEPRAAAAAEPHKLRAVAAGTAVGAAATRRTAAAILEHVGMGE